MTYLVDTDRVVDYLRGRSDAIDLLRRLEASGLSISVITFAEVYEGILFGRDRGVHETGFHKFLALATVLPITEPVARIFAEQRGTLRLQGQRLPDADLLIAATALHHDLTLVTRNLAHFQRIPGLRLHETDA